MSAIRPWTVPLAGAVLLSSLFALAPPAAAVPGCPPEPSYDYSIPEPVGPPAAAPVPGGNQVIFAALGSDRQAYAARTDIGGDPLRVARLNCFGGVATDNPAIAAVTVDGYAVFVRSSNGRIYERRVSATGTGTWTAVPGAVSGSGPAAVATTDGRVHLFVRDTSGALSYAVRTQAGSWSGFRSLGGQVLSVPSVAVRPGGGLAVLVRGPGNKIFANYSLPDGWSGWQEVPGGGLTGSNPAAAWGFQPNRLDVFVTGLAGGLYQQTYSNGRWNGWHRVDSELPSTARLAAAARPGRVIVYAAVEGAVVYKQYVGEWRGYFLAPYTCADCLPTAANRAARS